MRPRSTSESRPAESGADRGAPPTSSLTARPKTLLPHAPQSEIDPVLAEKGLPLEDLHFDSLQPLPLRRVALHYQMGFPILGRWNATRGLLAGIEKLLGALVPDSRATYVAARARRS